jgi:hypothetical protein
MGIMFSYPSEEKSLAVAGTAVTVASVKVLPEPILIRHRPTCLSTDLSDIINETEIETQLDTKVS